MSNQNKQNTQSSELEISLTFDGDKVIGAWYHPDLAPILCALCGKECKVKCTAVNPYCG